MKMSYYVPSLCALVFLSYYSLTGYGNEATEKPKNSDTTPQATVQTSNTVKSPLKNHKLLPQGYIINGRDAKLVKLPEENRWFLIFISDDKIDNTITSTVTEADSAPWWEKLKPDGNEANPLFRPIEVLPNQTLMTMVNILGNRNDTSITFRIWGDITTYKERNYILINDVGMLRLFGSILPKKTDQDKNKPLQQLNNNADLDTSENTSTINTEQDSLPEELRRVLLSIPRPRPIGEEQANITEEQTNKVISPIKSTETASESGSIAPKTGWRDGDLIIDRAGRLIYAGDQNEWLFTLESGGPNQPEIPLILHPNQLLEAMEKLWTQSNHRAQFRISGLATVYQNRVYLLMRKMQVVYDQGNLVP
ncbi:MAG: hypothetical protein JW709_06940 [Sedimentisphaerales bacterium]|nr:hypothetical protein [Sedimentisphaerales bacterium]